jgi:hypothetical protein
LDRGRASGLCGFRNEFEELRAGKDGHALDRLPVQVAEMRLVTGPKVSATGGDGPAQDGLVFLFQIQHRHVTQR